MIFALKDRDKEKSKEKDKSLEKEKAHNNDGKVGLGSTTTAASGNVHGKLHDSNSKNAKSYKKPTQTFVNVIELLLESICTFVAPPLKDDNASNVDPGSPTSSDMDIDVSTVRGKGKAVATVSEGNETSSEEASASLAKIVFILKLRMEILLMYTLQ